MTTDAPIVHPVVERDGRATKPWVLWFRNLVRGVFATLTVTTLTPNRLVSTDSNKQLVSVADLTAWIDSTADEIEVIDNGDGTVTIGLPDDVIISNNLTVNGNTCLKADSKLFFDN